MFRRKRQKTSAVTDRAFSEADVNAIQNFYQTHDISTDLLNPDRVASNLMLARKKGLNDAEALHAAVLLSLREQIEEEGGSVGRK